MEVGEERRRKDVHVEVLEVNPDHLEDGEDDVEAVT